MNARIHFRRGEGKPQNKASHKDKKSPHVEIKAPYKKKK